MPEDHPGELGRCPCGGWWRTEQALESDGEGAMADSFVDDVMGGES